MSNVFGFSDDQEERSNANTVFEPGRPLSSPVYEEYARVQLQIPYRYRGKRNIINLCVQYARIVHQLDDVSALLARSGFTTVTKSGSVKVHPLVQAQLQLIKQLQSLATSLRLNIYEDNAKLTLAENKNKAVREAQSTDAHGLLALGSKQIN
ncbi:P27 family phage terminase small subunit [Ruegeria sp. HKCCD7318]|uniref:P27 family phage terminase small subunit n=1 Tax=Ruegeria sp. HKCCD7318 TaxID=2683014 RepID=UPI001491F1AB|nr:P27 family phage terminase small subunit [Ruegeria sp. HKCCD7318]NOE32311.1 hypothetical protein [Ruegeria sp. HKCCD7318]